VGDGQQEAAAGGWGYLLRDSRRCRGGVTTMQVFPTREASAPSVALHAPSRCRTDLGNPRWNHPYRSHQSGRQQQDDGRCQCGRYRQQPPMPNCSGAGCAPACRGRGVRRLCVATASGPQLVGGGVDTAELLSEGKGAFGFGAVRKEAAGLPAQRVAVVPAPLLGSALGNERVLSEPTSSKSAATAPMRLRPAA
jgi:hypothetical protein